MAADPLVVDRSFSVTESSGLPPASSSSRRSMLLRRTARAARRAMVAAHQPHLLAIICLAGLTSLAATMSGEAMIATWFAIGGALAYVVVIALYAVSPTRAQGLYGPLGPPLDIDVLPGEIKGDDLRAAYQAVLRAHDEIRESLRASEEVHDILLEQYERCGELVQLAGRVAQTGNTLQTYLDNHDPRNLEREVASLQRRAVEATDAHAERAYRQSAEARRRLLVTYQQVAGFRDRIRARLELIVASLESVQILIVKLRALVLEEVMFSGESISGGLDVLREDLELLERAMDEALNGSIDPFEFTFDEADEQQEVAVAVNGYG